MAERVFWNGTRLGFSLVASSSLASRAARRRASQVASTFRHACPLVMYEDDQSEPIFLAPWTDAGLLRSYKYQKLKRGEDPIQRALEQHSLTKDGLAYNND